MGTNEANLLDSVVHKTQSEIILLAVIVAVVMVIFVLPLYINMSKDRRHKSKLESDRQDKFIERERQIIQVVTSNTEAITRLNATLEANSATTLSSFARIFECFDSQWVKDGERAADLAQIKSTLGRVENDASRILMIVDSIPNNSNFSSKGEDF